MNINRKNYEAYFIDFLDGNLSSEQMEELRSFLMLNPDLAGELDDVKMVMSDFSFGTPEPFLNKDALFKPELPISHDDLNELLAKEVEGTLLPNESVLLDELQNQYPFIAQSRIAFSKTRLPLEHIVFQDKNSLQFNEELDMSEDEILLIAFLEGDLSEGQQKALEIRLQHDNVLATNLAQLRLAYLPIAPMDFDYSAIKFAENIDLTDPVQLLVAKLEGDLSLEKSKALDAQINNNASMLAEYRLLQKTKLQPSQIEFDEKASLRKTTTVVVNFNRARVFKYTGAAAIVVGAILLTRFYQLGSEATLASQFEYRGFSIPKPSTHEVGTEKIEVDQSKISNPYSSKEYQSETKDVALIYEESDSVKQQKSRQLVPPMIHSIASTDLAITSAPALETSSVLIHQHEISTNRLFNAPESESLLSYIGKVAGAKIESTSVFALAERQIDKLTSHAAEEIEIRRLSGDSSDKLRLRVGSFAVERDARKRKNSEEGFIHRVNRVYRTISGE